MAKQTSTPTIEKDGFVLYRDMVSIANEALPDYHDKGKLFALITQFVNQQPLEDAPERVEMAFKFLKNGIEKNSAKYARKKAAMQAYYEERNKEKSEKSEKEDKSAKSKPAAKNTINNSISISTSNSYSDSDSDSNSNSNSDSHSKQGIINDTIKENINNSLSENKYTLDEVREILERERIFFKQNWLREFYHLNNITYKWKYDPVSAAHAYMKLHPDAVKGEKKKNTPPTPAAPPAMADVIAAAYAADGNRVACELWDAIYKEIRPKISDDDAAQFAKYLRPDIAWRSSYRSKVLRFKLDDTEVAFAELFKRIDPVIARFSATFAEYGVEKVKYVSTKPVASK